MDQMLLPRPQNLRETAESFELVPETVICCANAAALQPAELLAEYLRTATGFALEVKQTAAVPGGIVLECAENAPVDDLDMMGEHYQLSVKNDGVRLWGESPAALARGIQTLRQLFPAEIYAETVQSVKWQLPGVEIDDTPAFRWRGMMIDSARHFFDKKQVCRMIELFAQHKFNVVHLHLTDDQGWRVEIKKYPLLTEVGSIRQMTVIGNEWDRPRKYDKTPYGGYYTQEDLKEIVAFAAQRHITIVPEIDMPGHMAAAICAYPDWGCFPENKVPVRPHWGISYQILCPKQEVIDAMKDILNEVMDIFPGRFIHIGGDEARKDEWYISPDVQEAMAQYNCKDEKDLQDYFTDEMRKLINSRGRRMLGWEEILSGGMEKSSIILSWRNKGKESEAARMGVSSIVANHAYVYFDYYQADPRYEPVGGGTWLPLEKVYQFTPCPAGLTPEEEKFILGGQAQLWSEYIPTPEHQEYMAFPRACALAEKLWTKEEFCRLLDFKNRLNGHRSRLDIQKVSACPLP